MGRAKILVSHKLLEDWLRFPVNGRVYAIRQTHEQALQEAFEIYIEHPELPEGDQPPLIHPIIREIRWDWNLPKEETDEMP